jgi:AsmA-like C-terminal region/Domain of Unknown Function (DUF748)
MAIVRKRVVALLVLLTIGGAALVYSLTVLLQSRCNEAERELQSLLGSEASFATLEAEVWRGLAFSARDFRIADNPQFAATPFLHAQEVKLGVSLWHLVLGRFVIDSLTFIQPEFQVITKEDGLLNIAALANREKNLAEFPKLRTASNDRNHPLLNFQITRLKVIDGRVEFIDRSTSAPAQLRIQRVNLDVGGLDLAARAKIKLTASLTQGLGRDFEIEGELGPPIRGRSWSQQPVNLEMRFDSLYLPTLARALPLLRDRIPRDLEITGPMYLDVRLSGSLQQPRFSRIHLKVPLLGSSDYNAILTGSAELPAGGSWNDTQVAGTLTLTDISLSEFRKLPLAGQILPADLVSRGSVDVRSRFEGTWSRLRVGTIVDAGEAEFQVRDQWQKPAGVPAILRAQISRHHSAFVLHPSVLNIRETSVDISGALSQKSVSIRLHAGQIGLRALAPFIAPTTFETMGGTIDWDLLLEKPLDDPANGWQARGALNLHQAGLRHKASRTELRRLNAAVSFLGHGARVPSLSFQIGTAALSGAIEITDLRGLTGTYTLRSSDLKSTDIRADITAAPTHLKDVVSEGEMSFSDGSYRLNGRLSCSAADFRGITYRQLRAKLTWSPEGISFNDLRARAFNGEVRASGVWRFGMTPGEFLQVTPRLEGLNVRELLQQFAPDLKDRFDGQLDFSGEFVAPAGAMLGQALKGSGAALIHGGSINDFNLVARLFHRGGTDNQPRPPQRIPANLAAVLERENTPVNDFKAALTVQAQRIQTDDVKLTTPDYEITGAGWIDMDGATQWRGLIAFSPGISSELRRQYSVIRYFLDGKGRLRVGFRVEGKLPNVKIRPENAVLAQAFRWGTWQRGDDLPGAQRRREKHWLSDSLDRLLQR